MIPNLVSAPIGQVSSPVARPAPGRQQDVFLLDLDALVPATFGRIEEGFATYLKAFARTAPCYLLTSANYNEVMARLTDSLRHAFAGIFAASGTELWERDDVHSRLDHDFSDDLYEFIVKVVQASAYPHKLAPTLDCGSSTLRVRLAGMRSTARQRNAYAAWERERQELTAIMNEFRIRFPDYRIYRDAETGLLIMPEAFSSASVREQILTRHSSARLISYLSRPAAETYAQPLCESLPDTDVHSIVSAPSDVSHLLSYEKRRMSDAGQIAVANVPYAVGA